RFQPKLQPSGTPRLEFGWPERRGGGRCVSFAGERSRGTGPGTENGLDQLLGRIAGGRRILGGGKRSLLQLDGLSVAVQVSDAPGTLGQVLLELGPLPGGQAAEQVVVQELGEFAAVQASPPRAAGRGERGVLRPGVSGWRRPALGSGGTASSPFATM